MQFKTIPINSIKISHHMLQLTRRKCLFLWRHFLSTPLAHESILAFIGPITDMAK